MEKNKTRITSGSQSNITSNCSAIVEDKIKYNNESVG